jgi:hypothetical protein
MFAGNAQDANETATEPSTEETEYEEAEATPDAEAEELGGAVSLQVGMWATHKEPSPKPTGW